MLNNLNGSEIAVIGMSCRLPGAGSVDEFWNNIVNGVESISFFTPEELKQAGVGEDVLNNANYVRANGIIEGIENFDASFFGIGKREAEIMDPQHRVFLEEAYKALDDAGYSNAEYRRRVGVFAGCDMNMYLLMNWKRNEEQLRAGGDFLLMTAGDKDYLPTRTSYLLDLDGPSINVQTACSTSLVAIHVACQSLLSSESEIALAGGVRIHPPMKQGYLYVKDSVASSDGHCRPFDINAQGIVGGNGVGVVVLKLLTHAIRDKDNIYAVIKGSAVNNDGRNKVGYTAVSTKGQSEVIMEALAMADVDVSSIGYIETHGTGTKMGDAIEIQALNRAFNRYSKKRKPCALGGVKANIGHTSCAAGVAGFIKTVLIVKNGLIPPLVNFNEINPNISLADSCFYIPTETIEWSDQVRIAGVSSFGIGGTNAHLVLGNYHKPEYESVAATELISLSAHRPETLREVSANLASFIKSDTNVSLRDIAYTLHMGREYHLHRLNIVSRSKEELYESLTSSSSNDKISDHVRDSIPPVFFVFPGLGSQYDGMGAQLYNDNNLFRKHFDRCAALFSDYFEVDIRKLIIRDNNGILLSELVYKTDYGQSLTFCIEYALASVFIDYGIQPTAVIGHSLGDFAAAVIAGIISLPDAVMLVSKRGRLIENSEIGAMLSAMLTGDELQKKIDQFPTLSIAAINSPSNSTVSGSVEAINLFEQQLKADGILCHRLPIARAGHSKMMEPCVDEFRKITSKIQCSQFSIPMVSNVDGEMMLPQTGEYWITQLLSPVNFDKGVQQLLKYSSGIFIELGPGKTLTGLIRQNKMRNHDHELLPVLTNQTIKTEPAQLLEAIGHLWSKGIAVKFEKMYEGTNAHRCSLPTYPFTAKPYWIGKASDQKISTAANTKEVSFYTPVWKQSVVIARQENTKSVKELLLVFLSGSNDLKDIINTMQSDRYEVVLITKGLRFSTVDDGAYSIDPEVTGDYDQLFQDLSLEKNADINIWFDGCNSSNNEERPIEQRLIEISMLARQIGSMTSHRFKLHIITNSIHSVTGEETVDPSQSLLQGFSKIVSLEYANVRSRLIDLSLDSTTSSEFAGQALIRELTIDDSNPVIAIRGKQRFVVDYEKLDDVPGTGYRLKSNGVYLITGGFKGIAVQIALAIASVQSDARIALLGRSEMPDISQWTGIINDITHPLHAEILRLNKLRELVSGLKMIQCDVSDHKQVSNVIQSLQQDWGKINGVVHAAGLPDYFGIILNRTRENINEVLTPKVQGTLVLDSLLDYDHLDFFILFSSIATLFYKTKAGQVAYVAANEFIDAFSDYHKSIGKHKTSVINWNDWKEVGLSVKANSRYAAMLGIDTEHSIFSDAETPMEGQAAFLKLLALGHQRTIVSKKNIIDELDNYDQFDLAEFVKGIRKRPVLQHNGSGKTAADDAPVSEIQKTLCAIWVECLGVETIGIHDNFFELGGHSLLAIQMISRIQERLPAYTIPALKIIFKYPTISGLSEYMENMEWLQLEKSPAMEREVGSI